MKKTYFTPEAVDGAREPTLNAAVWPWERVLSRAELLACGGVRKSMLQEAFHRHARAEPVTPTEAGSRPARRPGISHSSLLAAATLL